MSDNENLRILLKKTGIFLRKYILRDQKNFTFAFAVEQITWAQQ